MKKKTDMAVEAFESGKVKEALSIAKGFTMGLSQDEHKQIVCGYECLVHESFYKQIGKDPKQEMMKAVDVFKEKIYHPYLERKEKAGA